MSNQRVGRISLSKQQLAFVMWIVEIDDPMEAVEAFVAIMAEEQADPAQMGMFVDKMMVITGKKK